MGVWELYALLTSTPGGCACLVQLPWYFDPEKISNTSWMGNLVDVSASTDPVKARKISWPSRKSNPYYYLVQPEAISFYRVSNMQRNNICYIYFKWTLFVLWLHVYVFVRYSILNVNILLYISREIQWEPMNLHDSRFLSSHILLPFFVILHVHSHTVQDWDGRK
jgi:hypothetical protein